VRRAERAFDDLVPLTAEAVVMKIVDVDDASGCNEMFDSCKGYGVVVAARVAHKDGRHVSQSERLEAPR
jgi:hypothetical protein